MSASSSRTGPSGAARWEVALWILAWCAARLALVLSRTDVFGYGEEFEKACAGKALLDCVPLRLHQLPYHPYEGGGFVVSLLDAFAFAAFGESVLATKLAAFLLGSAILAAAWAGCERFGGRAAARTFALLYVLAPESVQANSVLSLGIHYQACLFVALVVFFAARIAVARDVRRLTWLALGLASGFGLYFSYQIALTLLVVLAALAWTLKRELWRPRTAWAVLGLALGATPLAWMELRTGSAVLDIHGASVTGGWDRKLETLRAFATSLVDGRPWWDVVGLAVLALLPMAAWVALRRAESRTLRWVGGLVAAHAVVFLAAYLGGGFTVGKVHHYFYLHRLTPLWFVAIVLVALASATSKSVRRGAWLLALFGALDVASWTRSLDPSRYAAGFTSLAGSKGYRYSQYLQKISPRIDGTRAEKLACFLRFRERSPAALHDALAIALYGSGEGSFESMCDEIRAAGVQDLSGFYRGMGLMLMRHHGREFAPRIAVVQPFPPEIRDPLIEAIGRFGQWELSSEDTVLREAELGLASNFPEPFFVGLGRRLHDSLGDSRILHYFERRAGPVAFDRERGLLWLESVPEPARESMRRGYSAALDDWRSN